MIFLRYLRAFFRTPVRARAPLGRPSFLPVGFGAAAAPGGELEEVGSEAERRGGGSGRKAQIGNEAEKRGGSSEPAFLRSSTQRPGQAWKKRSSSLAFRGLFRM
jgi:hypothetical protein